MSRRNESSPYRDDPAPRAPSHRRSIASAPASRATHSATKSRRSRAAHPSSEPIVVESSNGNGTSNGRRPRRRGRKGKRGTPQIQLTSHPTSRNAYSETRQWLLEQHGPICAYCGGEFPVRSMTLDHVTPRRGQTAYDRRDNLVLACTTCNAAKRDLSAAAYLLAVRSRAANLLRYGSHLSPMLLDLARSLAPEAAAAVVAAAVESHGANGNGAHSHGANGHRANGNGSKPTARVKWNDLDDDESPYKD